MKILLVRKLGRNSLSLKLNISLRPSDLLCTSAEKLGFFLLLTAFSWFSSLNCFNLHNSEKFTHGPNARKWCKRKRLHGLSLGLKLSWVFNVIIPCWICSFPKYFWGKKNIKEWDAEKWGEREYIAEQEMRRSLKSCWFCSEGNLALPEVIFREISRTFS